MEGPMDVHDTKTQRDEDTATSATQVACCQRPCSSPH